MAGCLLRRRAALLLAGLAAVLLAAGPAGADPAPVPASTPANVLACGASGASQSLTSATPVQLAACTVVTPQSGLLVVLAAAGTERIDGPYEASASVTVDGATLGDSERLIDVGDAQRTLAVLGTTFVLPGSHAIALLGGRSALSGTARFAQPRLVALFVPDGSGIGVCTRSTLTFATAAASGVAASCTASSPGASHAIVLGGGVGAVTAGAYEARASLAVDGVEAVESRRTWNAITTPGDGTDVPFGTVAVVPVSGAAHTFSLDYARTSGTVTGLISRPSLVAIVVPDAGSRLRWCTVTDTAGGVIEVGGGVQGSCSLTATGRGSLLTTGGFALRPGTAAGASALVNLLASGATDGVQRILALPGDAGDGTDAPWQEASLSAVTRASPVQTGFAVASPGADPGALVYRNASLLGLFVPAADVTAPETSIASGPSGLVASRSAALALASPDDDATRFTCSLDGAAFADCPASYAVADLVDGPHDLRASAIDDVGNVDQTAAQRAWTVDATKPEVAITSPAQDAVVDLDGALTAAYACNDVSEHTCVADVASGGLLDTATAGQHELVVRSTDAAGNAQVATVRYHVTARPVTVTAGDATAVWGGPIPPIGATAVGLAPTDTIASLTGLRCYPSIGGENYPPPGPVPTFCNNATSDRYAITYVEGTLTLLPPVRATAARLVGRRLVVVPPGARSFELACTLDRPGIRSCTVDLRARIGGRLTTLATGLGRAFRPGAPPPKVEIAVDARLRRLARRPEGLLVVARMTAVQFGYPKPIVSTTPLLLAPATAVTLPADGLFRGTRLSAAGAASLAALRSTVAGARRLTCTGHTDALGPAAANVALGLARARVVCAALARRTSIRTASRSRGEARPRATNRTAAGRARNRRVVVGVGY